MKTSTTKTTASASILPAFVPVVPRCLAVLRLTAYMCDNKYSLRVSLKEDGTLAYSYFGGHGITGTSHSFTECVPSNCRLFASTEALVSELKVLLLPTYKAVVSVELLNQIF